MSQLSPNQVRQVALLARLRLSDAEVQELTGQLTQIIAFVEQLNQLPTEHVEPLAHVGDLSNVLADDRERPSLDRDAALANAPKRDQECFRVPAVLGEA